MELPYFILLVVIGGANGGTPAVEQLHFTDRATCEQAAAQVKTLDDQNPLITISALCVGTNAKD